MATRNDHRCAVGFSPEMVKLLQERAKENGRSLSKEIIQLVKAALTQEQSTKKGAVATDSQER